MLSVFGFCAVLGGTILVVQTVLSAVGFGFSGLDFDVDMGEVDMSDVNLGDVNTGDVDAGDGIVGHGSWAGFHVFKVLSFRTMVAGITFFGLTGWGTLNSTNSPFLAMAAAVMAGLTAVILVYFLYRAMYSLRNQGNVSSDKLVGATGSVYVRIPAQGKGAGKVLVSQQNRTMEYEAFSTGKELSTGTQITVIKVVSPTAVEVCEVR